MSVLKHPYARPILAILVGVAIVGVIVLLESRKADVSGVDAGDQSIAVLDESERTSEKEKRYERAKEISTPDAFINTEPVSIGELVGEKVILVDFWTYSCINCQRTLPYLNSWHEKYVDDGLVILGLHTPEFEFEKELENVQRAVEKFGVGYPVILDNDFSTWRSYKNQYWPRKYLIDIDGFIVYDHIGEGAYEETEKKIVELLNERSQVLGMQAEVMLDESAPDEIDEVDFSQVRSPEMYLGHKRIERLANLPSRDCFDSECTYITSGGVSLNTFSLHGTWFIGEENAELRSDSGSIFLGFSASKVNLVAGADTQARAEIYLDGERIETTSAGSDVVDGTVTFGSEDLYNLVDLRGEYGNHLLEIRFLDEGASAFAFTFG